MKFIQSKDKALLEELCANLFEVVAPSNAEIMTAENGTTLKFDEEALTDVQLMIIEAAISSRIASGVMPEGLYEVNEMLISTSFSLTASSVEKYQIIKNDILRGAKVSEQNMVTLQQPFAPNMYNSLIYVVVAFNLSEDQMQAVELSTKVAQQGIKVTNWAKKAGMVGGSTANVLNRVSREVTLAGVEIGATVAVGTVKTAVEATACVANIAIRDLNHKELLAGDNVQTLFGTIKALRNNKSNKQVSRGFGAL
ncbi:hypothetical protein [Paraclostridium dentum]|uniref:hypothetical protein n=1 Tax=Paraclostridium dentum TaxID=2662455 RepID=UPI003F2F594A